MCDPGVEMLSGFVHVQEAFVLERDRRAAEAVEEELRRLHELDRLHRQRNGAADTNLAALRDRVRA